MKSKQEYEYFDLTEEHIKLLSRVCISWQDCEFGAPEINPKRPYGNSDVISDIAEILEIEIKECPHCGEKLTEFDNVRLKKLHRETETALQIILVTKSFKVGKYRKHGYDINWELVEELSHSSG
jgi:hypothetical protein